MVGDPPPAGGTKRQETAGRDANALVGATASIAARLLPAHAQEVLMDRRSLFIGSGALAAARAAPRMAMAATSKTFVLVHGAWHGGWCWSEVAAILRGRGHRIFTPTQTWCWSVTASAALPFQGSPTDCAIVSDDSSISMLSYWKTARACSASCQRMWSRHARRQPEKPVMASVFRHRLRRRSASMTRRRRRPWRAA